MKQRVLQNFSPFGITVTSLFLAVETGGNFLRPFAILNVCISGTLPSLREFGPFGKHPVLCWQTPRFLGGHEAE